MPVRLIKSLARRLFGKKDAAAHSVPRSPASSPPVSTPGGHRADLHARHPGPSAPPREAHRDAPSATHPGKGAPARHAPAPWTPESFVVPPQEGKTRFHDLPLPVEIMHAVSDLGFHYCTPIQAAVLPLALDGRNVAGKAQTGTGKTAAFLIGTMARFLKNPDVRPKPGKPRSLVIAPTRELVDQIYKDAMSLGAHTRLRFAAVYGGIDYEKQRRRVTEGPVDILAATPGRLLDFKRQGALDLSQVEVCVIDEADRMLDMGFIPDVKSIMRSLPPRERRQTLLFSATLSKDVLNLAAQWMPDQMTVEVNPEQVAVDTVEQVFYSVAARDKFKLLYNLLQQRQMERVLVFGNRRTSVQRLVDYLHAYGIPCDQMSGAVAQNKRMKLLEDFRSGRLRVVVATDVAARGLHIDDISHVINFELPYEPDGFVHRIGRTGRAGATGTAVSFACEDESFIIPEIEAYVGHPIRCQQPEESLLKELPAPVAKVRPSHGDGPPRREAHGRGRDGRGGGRRR